MEVWLLRHGKTAGNLRGCYNGRTDEPLCTAGIEGAQKAGVYEDVRRVYVSPLLRARQTAEICFPNAEQIVIADLREMDFGIFEGRTADEMENDTQYRAWVDGNCEGVCPNGESISGFRKRVCQAFHTIVYNAVKNKEKRIIVVAHGGTLMAILSSFVKKSNSYYDWHVPNCCGWRALINAQTWSVNPALTEYSMFERLIL